LRRRPRLACRSRGR